MPRFETRADALAWASDERHLSDCSCHECLPPPRCDYCGARNVDEDGFCSETCREEWKREVAADDAMERERDAEALR